MSVVARGALNFFRPTRNDNGIAYNIVWVTNTPGQNPARPEVYFSPLELIQSSSFVELGNQPPPPPSLQNPEKEFKSPKEKMPVTICSMLAKVALLAFLTLFLQSEFSNASSNGLTLQMQSRLVALVQFFTE